MNRTAVCKRCGNGFSYRYDPIYHFASPKPSYCPSCSDYRARRESEVAERCTIRTSVRCPDCEGAGRIGKNRLKCGNCNGKGTVTKEESPYGGLGWFFQDGHLTFGSELKPEHKKKLPGDFDTKKWWSGE